MPTYLLLLTLSSKPRSLISSTFSTLAVRAYFHYVLSDLTFRHAALIDFETDEIVNLIRALFAETQQRANAVDHVQAGHPAVR